MFKLGKALIAVGDGATIWLAWQRSWVNVGVGFVNDVVLRGYDGKGNPVTPELAPLANASLGRVTASGGGGSNASKWDRLHDSNALSFGMRTVACREGSTT
jgi:hypothetical protein